MAAAVTDAFKGDSHPLPLCVSTSVGKVPTSVPGPAPRSGHGRTTFENAVASNCTLVPSNRLVAGTLERRRNDAIQRLNELETELANFERQAMRGATVEQRQQILRLGRNFPRQTPQPRHFAGSVCSVC